MLKIITILDPSQRWDIFSQMDMEETSLLVSDIKTKLSVEKYLLEKRDFLSGPCVLRVQDFFELLFYNSESSWQIVSDSFLSHKFLEFVWSHENNFKSLHQSKILMDYLNQFLPILFYPDHSSLLKEWFKDKGSLSSNKWEHWFSICQDFFELMKREKIIHQSGIKFIIMNDISTFTENSFTKKHIVSDLGLSLDSCETLILKELSSKKDITILAPKFREHSFYTGEDNIYTDLLKETPLSQRQTKKSKPNQQIQFLKIKNETTLQEVKKVTAQVRKWLDQGVPHKDITILAPNIESYWPSLKNHLEKENISFTKSVTSRLSHFASIRYWLSSMHIYLGSSEFSQLEEHFFYKENSYGFQKFYNSHFKTSESIYSNIPIYKKDKKQNPEGIVSGEEFIEWALSFLPNELDEKVLDRIYQICNSVLLHQEFKWKSWLSFLESEVFACTIEIIKEQGDGISCISFNAIHSLRGSHVFILGLDEDSIQTHFSTILNQKEREALVSDLGFNLAYPHPKEKEYQLIWMLQSSILKEVFLSYSATDFSGNYLTPSLFYILADTIFDIQKGSVNNINTWDSIKQQKDIKTIFKEINSSKNVINNINTYFKNNELVAQSKDIDFKNNELVDKNIINDVAFKNNELVGQSKDIACNKESFFQSPQTFLNEDSIKLSASRLELYFQCSFKYAAKYLLYIDELPLADRELSLLDAGNITHQMFQLILEEPSLKSALENLDTIMENLNLNEQTWIHPTQQDIVKKNLLKLANEFIEAEIEKQEALPYLKPFAFEKEIKGFWNKELNQLNHKGDYSFTGKIDRIDHNLENQTFWLIDYKRSVGTYTHMDHWVKKGYLQLFLYVQAAEAGLIEGLDSLEVSALLYYFYKNFSYKGYIDKSQKSKNDIFKSSIYKENSKWKEASKKAQEIIQNIVQSIEAGKFLAKPHTEKVCDRCSHSKWCRAAHLQE